MEMEGLFFTIACYIKNDYRTQKLNTLLTALQPFFLTHQNLYTAATKALAVDLVPEPSFLA